MDSHTQEARRLAEELQGLGWQFVTEPAWSYEWPSDGCAMKGVDY